MDLEDTILSEISEIKKNKYYMVSYVKSKKKKRKRRTHRYREQIGGCQRWEVGEMNDSKDANL